MRARAALARSAAEKKALEIVISITKERLARSYFSRNSNRSDGNGSRWVAASQLVPTAELLGSNWQFSKTAFVLTTCTFTAAWNPK